MDMVYASLTRRRVDQEPPAGEVAEISGALWAHALAEDGLEYVSGCSRSDRVDLLLFLLTHAPPAPDGARRAGALLARCHQASRRLRQDYLPPQSPLD